jgi:hypothetical protein
MSAFNVVQGPNETCTRCGSSISRDVQFKYGDTWQHEYEVGDRIEWGGNDLGEPAELVIVTGIGDLCPVCGYLPEYELLYEIIVDEGVIESVQPSADRTLLRRQYLVVRE